MQGRAVDSYERLTSTCYQRKCAAQCYLSQHDLPGAPEPPPDQTTGQSGIMETGKGATRGQTEGRGDGEEEEEGRKGHMMRGFLEA